MNLIRGEEWHGTEALECRWKLETSESISCSVIVALCSRPFPSPNAQRDFYLSLRRRPIKCIDTNDAIAHGLSGKTQMIDGNARSRRPLNHELSSR